MLKIETTGLDELQKKLSDLADKAQMLDGQHHVPVSELLTVSFLSKHTRFSSANDLFAASGYKVETKEDFAAIPDDKWDDFIRSISSFVSWEAMLGAAGKEWATKQLGF
jgi:hypothetical protein